MNKLIYGLAISAAIGAATFSLPASAAQVHQHNGAGTLTIQFYGGGRSFARQSILPERRIRRRLRRQGFHQIQLLNFNPNRGVYRVEAHDHYHQHRIVIVDAWTGRVVRTRPFFRNWRNDHNWSNGFGRRRGWR